MNKEWIELLAGAKNFDEGELNKHIVKNWSNICRDNISAGIMTYRNELLKQMDIPKFDEGITVENLQKWFLQPINEQDFNFLMEAMKTNYWTIQELWEGCKNDSVGIMSLVQCLNENVKFYEGMKIYHRGHVVNVLTELDAMRINYLKNEELFQMDEFLHDIEMDTIPMALGKQVKRIRNKRREEATDFSLTRENVQYLEADIMLDGVFHLLKQVMKINHWTLKELVREAQKMDMNLFAVSGCPNKAVI